MKLGVAFFTTTKGHYGRQHHWKDTYLSFKEKMFTGSFVHCMPLINIVRSKGHDEVFQEMISFFKEDGVDAKNILVRDSEWKHHDVSFHSGYLLDFLNVYSQPQILDCDYVFHLEDDWEIINDDSITNSSNLYDMIMYLEKNPSTMQVKLCREKDEIKRIRSLPDILKFKKTVKDIDKKIFQHSDLFSFNPHINRPRDIYLAVNYCNSIYKQNALLQQNYEMGFTEIIVRMSLTDTPFAALKHEYLPIKHTGGKESE